MRARTSLLVAFLLTLGLLYPRMSPASEAFNDAMQRAGEAMAGGDTAEALEVTLAARQLAETPEERYDTYMAEAGLCQMLDRDADARLACRNALAVDGVAPDKRFGAYFYLVTLLADAEMPDEAMKVYRQALAEDFSPGVRAVARLSFASFCAQQGKHADALKAYSQVLELREAAPDLEILALVGIGDAHVGQGKFEEALGDYLKALLLPDRNAFNSSSICYGVGKALMGLDRHTEARLLLSTCAESEGFLPVLRVNAYGLLEKSFRQEDMTEEAEHATQGALAVDLGAELDEDRVLEIQSAIDSASLLAIGRYFKEAGKDEQARTALDKLAEDENAPDQVREEAHALLEEMD